MPPNIPDRWLDYKPVGEIIKGTRFIAFKVPLREGIVRSVPSDVRLDCGSLLDKIPNLGMIIDLTNTRRYYDPSIFQEQGLVYEKVMIPGKEVPQNEFVKRFKMVVNNFLQANANNDKLIGVHCTHGVNRTGYLLSSFMISELKMSPEEAIKCFEEARGHAIERNNYRNDLLGVAARPSHNDDSRGRCINLPSNHNIWRRNDNNRSPNHQPIENWRVPQSNSNNKAPSERSFAGNRYNSSINGSRQSHYYARDERSSNERNERQYSQQSNTYDRDDTTAPFERSFALNRYNSSSSGSRQSNYYARDERSSNERIERPYSQHRNSDDRDDNTAPFERSFAGNRYNSRQSNYYARDERSSNERIKRPYSQHRNS